jgi:hypothetical protein
LGLFLLAMLAACTDEGEVGVQNAQGVVEPVTIRATAESEVSAFPRLTVDVTDTVPPATDAPSPTTLSTELSNCVTTIAYLATKHWHGGSGGSPALHPSHFHPQPFAMLNHYCGSYIDSQLLEKFSVRQYGVPTVVPVNLFLTREEVMATEQAIRDR